MKTDSQDVEGRLLCDEEEEEAMLTLDGDRTYLKSDVLQPNRSEDFPRPHNNLSQRKAITFPR